MTYGPSQRRWLQEGADTFEIVKAQRQAVDRVLDQSRRYIEDFDQTVARSSTPREVIDEMLAGTDS